MLLGRGSRGEATLLAAKDVDDALPGGDDVVDAWRVEDARGEVAAGGEELLEVEATARGREAGWWRTAVDLGRGRTELSAEVTLLGGAQGRVDGGTGVGVLVGEEASTGGDEWWSASAAAMVQART